MDRARDGSGLNMTLAGGPCFDFPKPNGDEVAGGLYTQVSRLCWGLLGLMSKRWRRAGWGVAGSAGARRV